MLMLNQLRDKAFTVPVNTQQQNFVIFSDLHMGDGSRHDDFLQNSDLFQSVLKTAYLETDSHLVLNGDIEDLQKFTYPSIRTKWQEVYRLFNVFQDKRRFYKIYGNHDMNLILQHEQRYRLYEAVRLLTESGELLVFHGHQATPFYEKYNQYVEWSLRYLAKPLGIKNYDTAHSNRRKKKIETRAYEFSSSHKIVSVIGHTHRPLFEAHSRTDWLKLRIEMYLQAYKDASEEEQDEIAATIKLYMDELRGLSVKKRNPEDLKPIYSTLVPVPCLFNSGCVIGKRGITCLEISRGEIRLVYWFRKELNKKYFSFNGYRPEPLGSSGIYRVVLQSDHLTSIFNRIKLLN